MSCVEATAHRTGCRRLRETCSQKLHDRCGLCRVSVPVPTVVRKDADVEPLARHAQRPLAGAVVEGRPGEAVVRCQHRPGRERRPGVSPARVSVAVTGKSRMQASSGTAATFATFSGCGSSLSVSSIAPPLVTCAGPRTASTAIRRPDRADFPQHPHPCNAETR